jgi:hypothetical protein
MKLEIGMYVRLVNDVEDIVIINKIANVFENSILTENDGSIYQGEYTKENVIKASYNIIDLIEVGDFVNGLKVTLINEPSMANCYKRIVYAEDRKGYLIETFTEKDIKSIVTHEQMEQMAYKVGDE